MKKLRLRSERIANMDLNSLRFVLGGQIDNSQILGSCAIPSRCICSAGNCPEPIPDTTRCGTGND